MRSRRLQLVVFVSVSGGYGGRMSVCRRARSADGAKTIKLAFVTNNSADFWTIARRGVEKADAELADVDAEFRLTSDGTAAEQQRIVDDLLTKGVDGIAISPVDPQNQTALINAAAKRALVFTQDSDAPQTDRRLLHRHRQRGRRPPGRAAHSRSHPRRRIDHAVRRQARRAECAGADPGHQGGAEGSKIRIIDVRTDDVDDVRAKANAADTLVRYPDIKGLVGLWSYNGPAILNAVREAGKVGRVRIVAFDEADETLAGVKDGAIHATVVQQPYEFGYQAIMRMAQAVRGDRSFIPASKQIIVPTLVVNRANVEEFTKRINELRGRSSRRVSGITSVRLGRGHDEPDRSPPFPFEPGPDRRAARHRIVAGRHRLRAGRPRTRACVHSAVARACGLRPARAGRLSRASGPRDLHGRVRARLAPGRREGVSHRRRARGQGAWRADHPLSGRQLRLRLQLARRRRPEGAAADGARAGVELARDESVRHQRLHRLVPRGRNRAAARHELRHRHARRWRSPTSSTATSIAARSGATCGGRTATSSRTTCATGAWATRWTAPGRSASCRRASTGARRATSPDRCGSSIAACS